jgi:CII-binding regulator of phage lambda lysogenization HflD
MTAQPLEPRLANLETLISYMAETQRMMAENITKLTESQLILQERQSETDERFNILLDEVRHLGQKLNDQE